ncbi:hypothetical protein ACT3TH_10635 [Psychrobacter sp. AOP22-C1-C5]|uniref:hypothetical protein n=1 Tax=Psychrobacter sp. AOP22-C1-C5 TaxID=3457716 RepID=UPI0040370CDB
MQIKHLIIFSLVGIVALLGFNLINGNQHEENREMIASDSTSQQETAGTEVSGIDNANSSSTSIASKPLGEQPKAILDDATVKIDQAQQADQARLVQMESETQ